LFHECKFVKMKVNGIVKQLKSGKYIIEITSVLGLIKGKFKVILNAHITISTSIFKMGGKYILFLTHQLYNALGLLLDDRIDIDVCKTSTLEGIERKTPISLLY
jgi:hypothetical protein